MQKTFSNYAPLYAQFIHSLVKILIQNIKVIHYIKWEVYFDDIRSECIQALILSQIYAVHNT